MSVKCGYKNPSEDHCLASQGFAEWCQTVIPRVGFFYPHQPTMIEIFYLYSFWPPAFDFNIGSAINESPPYTLTTAVLKVDFVCDIIMTSTPNVLTTELRDLYN